MNRLLEPLADLWESDPMDVLFGLFIVLMGTAVLLLVSILCIGVIGSAFFSDPAPVCEVLQ